MTVSAEPSGIAVELDAPAGERLVVEWDPEALGRLDPAADPGDGIWRLSGELDWDQVESLRLISGRLADRRVLAVAALRPAGAPHGEEIVAGWLGEVGGPQRLAEVLVSTEYGPDGLPRRIGLELCESEGAVPARVAGTVVGSPGRAAHGRGVRAALELRHAGNVGAAVYDQISAG